MTAKEARLKAEQSKNNDFQKQLAVISARIDAAVKKGEMSINTYLYVRDDVRRHLESLGYQVGKNLSFRNEDDCTISW